ncbi:MAG: 5'-methylthioadenosine/S-adenosylhomocysteine nucleosidase [Bacilli bacterium]|nr:5'-methylthioadenosine/S-adenosylhomocysteine nucleosidase [Bacilli bacterium]
MKKLLFCYAMDSEAKPILEKAVIKSTESFGQAKLHDCAYDGHGFYVLVTGIGKVAAGAGLAAVLCQKEVTHVFDIGVGGSIEPEKAPVRTAVIGSRYAQHDMDTSPIGDEVGLISGINLVYLPSDENGVAILKEACEKVGAPYEIGTIASGDLFVSKEKERERIRKLFKALSCDMETAALAQVAYAYGIPFNGLRMISDAGKVGEYLSNLPHCSEKALEIVLTVLGK